MLFLPQKGTKDFGLSGLRYNEELIEYFVWNIQEPYEAVAARFSGLFWANKGGAGELCQYWVDRKKGGAEAEGRCMLFDLVHFYQGFAGGSVLPLATTV